MRRFTPDHEWVEIDNDIATVGITPFAQDQLGELVFVALPEIGHKFARGEAAATVESVKAASEIYAPLSGEIVEANTALTDQPGLINSSPTDAGWIFKMKITDPGETEKLLTEDAYQKLTA